MIFASICKSLRAERNSFPLNFLCSRRLRSQYSSSIRRRNKCCLFSFDCCICCRKKKSQKKKMSAEHNSLTFVRSFSSPFRCMIASSRSNQKFLCCTKFIQVTEINSIFVTFFLVSTNKIYRRSCIMLKPRSYTSCMLGLAGTGSSALWKAKEIRVQSSQEQPQLRLVIKFNQQMSANMCAVLFSQKLISMKLKTVHHLSWCLCDHNKNIASNSKTRRRKKTKKILWEETFNLVSCLKYQTVYSFVMFSIRRTRVNVALALHHHRYV